MPRKQFTRALGSKPNELGTKRKNSPGRYLETTDKLAEAGSERNDGKHCAWDNRVETATGKERVMRCSREATEYVRFAWWCPAHAPTITPCRGGCSHPSHLWGRLVCTWCGSDCGPIPEKTHA